jgi:hypothetical protein
MKRLSPISVAILGIALVGMVLAAAALTFASPCRLVGR